MKKLISAFVIYLFAASSFSQITLWAKKDGGLTDDQGKGIHTDNQGNSYVTGTFTGTTTIGPNTFVSRGGTDVFLLKMDASGAVIWSVSMGSSLNDECRAVCLGRDGYVYVGGNFGNAHFYFSASDSLLFTSGNTREAFFGKFSTSGTLQGKFKDSEFGKSIDVNDITVAANGDIFAGGRAWQPSSDERMYLKRFNNTGVQQWSKITFDGYANGLSLNASGTHLYVAGSCTTGFDPMGAPEFIQGGWDVYLAKVAVSNGGYTYVNSLGSTTDDYGKDVEIDGDGNIIFGCQYSGPMGIGSALQFPFGSINLPDPTGSAREVAIIKFNDSNGVWWFRRSGNTTSSTDVFKIRTDRFNNVFAHGTGTGSWVNNGSGVTGIYNVKLHKSFGDVLWRSAIAIAGTSGGSIGVDSLGNVYTTGYFNSTRTFGTISLTAAGGQDVYVFKQGSINILSPALGKKECANNERGDTMLVTFQPTYALDSGNVYTVQMDTLPPYNFTAPVTLGTLSSTAGTGSVICTIPAGTDPLTAGLRVNTSHPANVGEDIWIDMYEMPRITSVPSHILRKCTGVSRIIQAQTTVPAGYTNTWSWSPMTNLSVNTVGANSTGTTTINSNITYTISVTSSNTCRDTQVVQVLMNPLLTVNAGPDTTICPGDTLVMMPSFNDSALASTFSWSPASAFSNPAALNALLVNPGNGIQTYILTVTDTNGCVRADNVAVQRLTSPPVNAGPPLYSICPGSSLQLVATNGGASSAYNWQPAQFITNNPLNDSVMVAPVATTTFTVTATSVAGCSGRDTIRIVVEPLTINAGNDLAITCGNQTPITATHPPGIYPTPYTYAWSPTTGLFGTNALTTTASPIATTDYTITMTTGNGCTGSDVVRVNVNGANYNLNFSGTPQLFSSPPFNVQFTNATPSMANYNFTWLFGDGQSQATNNANVFHTYINNGTYDVSLIAVNIATGCSDTLFQGSYIFCSGANTCNVTASVSTPNGPDACTGDSVLLSCNTGAGYSYQWKLNGSNISGATSPAFYTQQTGSYTVEITESPTCSAISAPVIITMHPAPSIPAITQQGTLYSCGTDTVTLGSANAYAGYLWNTGDTTQFIAAILPGSYQLTVYNAQGCENQGSYVLSLINLPATPVCIVGVDSLTGHNLVTWNNDSNAVVDSFFVYREGIIANQYERIGSQDASQFSTFLDGSSNPFQQAYRYKLSIRDSCGNESALSDHHRTIHLTVNAGPGATWNLIWNSYEGFPISTYHIYRGTSASTIAYYTSISGSNNSYTDLTPPAGMIYYQIEVEASNCDPSLGRSYNASRSNVANTGTTSIDQAENTNHFLLIPNPASGTVTVDLHNSAFANNEARIDIVDHAGRIIYCKNSTAENGQISAQLLLGHLAEGIYTVRMISASVILSEKLVIINP